MQDINSSVLAVWKIGPFNSEDIHQYYWHYEFLWIKFFYFYFLIHSNLEDIKPNTDNRLACNLVRLKRNRDVWPKSDIRTSPTYRALTHSQLLQTMFKKFWTSLTLLEVTLFLWNWQFRTPINFIKWSSRHFGNCCYSCQRPNMQWLNIYVNLLYISAHVPILVLLAQNTQFWSKSGTTALVEERELAA